jgi:hypothetical protein
MEEYKEEDQKDEKFGMKRGMGGEEEDYKREEEVKVKVAL